MQSDSQQQNSDADEMPRNIAHSQDWVPLTDDQKIRASLAAGGAPAKNDPDVGIKMKQDPVKHASRLRFAEEAYRLGGHNFLILDTSDLLQTKAVVELYWLLDKLKILHIRIVELDYRMYRAIKVAVLALQEKYGPVDIEVFHGDVCGVLGSGVNWRNGWSLCLDLWCANATLKKNLIGLHNRPRVMLATISCRTNGRTRIVGSLKKGANQKICIKSMERYGKILGYGKSEPIANGRMIYTIFA